MNPPTSTTGVVVAVVSQKEDGSGEQDAGIENRACQR
jgi:hypothetical protein